MVTFEWIAAILIGAIFTLIGLIYKNLNEKCDGEAEARQAATKAIWAEINTMKKDTAIILSIQTNLSNIEKRLEEMPTHKDLYEQFNARDDKIERKLDAIIHQDRKFEAIITLLTKDSQK